MTLGRVRQRRSGRPFQCVLGHVLVIYRQRLKSFCVIQVPRLLQRCRQRTAHGLCHVLCDFPVDLAKAWPIVRTARLSHGLRDDLCRTLPHDPSDGVTPAR